MKSKLILFLVCFCSYTIPLFAQSELIILKGGTILDLDDFGKSAHDLRKSIVQIRNGKILSVSPEGKVKIPKEARVMDIAGAYLIPGLIDGFGSVANQRFANAYLYTGVTSVVTVEDERRGKTFLNASPSPTLYKLDEFGGADRIVIDSSKEIYKNVNYRTGNQIKWEIDSMVQERANVMLIHYGVKNEQLPVIVAVSKANRLPTIGELGFSTYAKAVESGINSFVHTSRYSADILPDSVREAYSNAPFGKPGSFFYQYINSQQLTKNQKLLELADTYGKNKVGLMPTGSLLVYPYLPSSHNPWEEKAASLIDDKDIIHLPLDRKTGKPISPPPFRAKAAKALLSIDSIFAKKGAHFLTGSGATAFGTLPGISLYTELEYLSALGLTNREVLAAATTNFSVLWNWNQLGKIEAGRDADILVLPNNPLDSLTNLKKIRYLILKGKIIDREGLLKR